MQVNVQLPDNLTPGSVPVAVSGHGNGGSVNSCYRLPCYIRPNAQPVQHSDGDLLVYEVIFGDQNTRLPTRKPRHQRGAELRDPPGRQRRLAFGTFLVEATRQEI